ncbi:hypothetical protein ETB97_006376 [Aspergillus alliaceus]|uniref:Uncharacterized protein n=1 Tax=Petromyces alliaceus TaxID=209559 RepID=A0A5N6FY34_PETAA|nr:uncharacterized protein BDW43DRAFT_309717 [Aspergillus alliaceus]KAB8234878.1 hypothetical protein BDW43DRAFT_309717 [Aspergillus alliaceus]KAF5864837.1 hypothetical protein ETB97_006376 [Aspergillus burnettii]
MATLATVKWYNLYLCDVANSPWSYPLRREWYKGLFSAAALKDPGEASTSGDAGTASVEAGLPSLPVKKDGTVHEHAQEGWRNGVPGSLQLLW